MWAASAGAIAYSSRKVRTGLDERKVPLMGVLGAFLFAAQMINFTIPATGSSGHLGGGMLLAILLGPNAAFLTIASILFVQALFFADGGLLALGCNIFNLGFFPAFIAYPLIYRNIAGRTPGHGRQSAAIILASVIGLQLGAFAVVLETVLSGVSSLPMQKFVLLMQPIHLAIGLVEGLVTTAIVSFIIKARPEILTDADVAGPETRQPFRKLVLGLLAAALLTGGILSLFASDKPDGLEWAIQKVTGTEALATPQQGIHGAMASVQEKTSFLPDYSFRKAAESKDSPRKGSAKDLESSSLGTSLAGLAGGIITLAVALLVGVILRKKSEA